MTGLLLDTQLSEEQRRLGETVRTSAESLLTLINDILDLSKVEAGKMELEKIDFDLYALCDEFSAAFAIRAHDKGLEFASIIAPDVPRKLHGDPGRLRQILSNLVANSIKFSEHGEVVVRLQLVDNQVSEPQASGPGGRAVKLRIEVSDTGIGIPADKLHVLFKKFSQVDASVTRTHGGTGLGLAICRELVKMMGGDIGVESVEGRGSTFWLTVNLEAKAERSVLGRRRKLVSFSANPLTRVLVLERHVPQRESVAGRLRGYGLVPVEAETVDEAQAELEAASARGEPYRFVLAEDTAPSRLGLDLVARLADAVADRGFQAPDVVLVRPVTVREAPPNLEGVRIAAVLTRPAGYAELFGCMAHLLNGGPTATWPIRTSRQESNESQKKLLEGRRVLLVEDNAVNQAVALGMLRKIGVRADAVGNGVEALNALAEFPYDLCLMDVQMPVLDGLEATRRLRSGAAKVLDPHVPVIALTANAMRGDREVCMQAGMDDYLPKPVTMDRVRAVVEKWLAPGASHRRGSGIMLPNPVEMAETCGDGGSRTMLLPSPTPTDKPETSDDGVKED